MVRVVASDPFTIHIKSDKRLKLAFAFSSRFFMFLDLELFSFFCLGVWLPTTRLYSRIDVWSDAEASRTLGPTHKRIPAPPIVELL